MIGPAPWRMFGDEWFATRQAAKLFFLASLLTVTMTLLVFAWMIPVYWTEPLQTPAWERIPWGILGVACPVAMGFLYFGMRHYWVRLDDSRVFIKRLWFPVVFFGLWWGSCLYYYCVYLPQVLRKWEAES